MTPEKREFILKFVAAEMGSSYQERCMMGNHHQPDSVEGLISDGAFLYDMVLDELERAV
jgi:hypothetical protein